MGQEPIIAVLADGTELEFPPGTSMDVVRAKVKERTQQGGAEPTQPEQERSLSGFAGNVLKSGANALKGIGDLIYGGVNMQMGNMTPQGMGLVNTISNPGQIVDAYKDRYGSMEAIGNTAYEDPVGLGLDVSSFASGLGGVARGVGRGMQRSGLGLMRRAANVPEKVIATSPYAPDDLTIPQTMLNEGINPTTAGRRKLDNIIAPLGTQKGQRVDQSNLTYNPHDPATLPHLRQHIQDAQQFDTVAPQFPVGGQSVLNDFLSGTKHNRPFTPIQQVSARTIHAGPQSTMPETMVPIQQASMDKVRIGQGLSDSAWATNPADQIPKATADAQRALYGDLAAQEARIPGVAALNQQLDPLYATRDHLVKGLGVPSHDVPYPSTRAALAGFLNNSFGAMGGYGARGTYQTGQALGTLGQATPPPATAAFGLPNMLQQQEEEAFRQLQEQQGDWWSPVPRLRP